jgi:hypothetical protein
MNEETGAARDGKPVDPKIAADWARVEARRADLNSRTGGDARRQAILKRLRFSQAVGFPRILGNAK